MIVKRIIAVMLVVVIALVGCGDGGGGGTASAASERNINIATRALEIADEFLDASVSAGVAHDRIVGLANINTTRTGDVSEDSANLILGSRVLSLRTSLRAASWDDTTENYDEVLEERNALAEAIGVRRR